ncbi:hypothetical protein ACT3TY_09180 [Halomonas sp. AOP22-C1-8]|uniref:hypothetical protein n=1 Tax=Halomonas sp. AOP22-C1-8 TaxID=3457717 RepID=UPI004033A7A4
MTMTVGELFIALVIISLALVASNALRLRIGWLRRLFLPSSVIAGLVLLLMGPDVIGRLLPTFFEESPGLFPTYVQESWSALPGLLINVVFAALFIGKTIPGIRTIWLRAGP